MKCYHCGNDFVLEELTKEHIPPRCFSDAYPPEYKVNRITVPCCHPCNNEFSKIDSELRDAIAIAKDGSDGNQKFLEKGIKSVVRRKKLGQDYSFDTKAKTYAIDFDYSLFEQMFLKCHKGLFYHKFGVPVDEHFVTTNNQKHVNEQHDTPIHQRMEQLHKENPESFLVSGHPDIFQASILAFQATDKGTFEVTDDLDKCFAVTSYLVFHDIIDCVVVSVKKGTWAYEKIKGAL